MTNGLPGLLKIQGRDDAPALYKAAPSGGRSDAGMIARMAHAPWPRRWLRWRLIIPSAVDPGRAQ